MLLDQSGKIIEITPEEVLLAQNADPQTIRERKPRLWKIAEQAVEMAVHLTEPAVYLKRFRIEKHLHKLVWLENGLVLKNQSLAQNLAGSEVLNAVICTVGGSFDTEIDRLMQSDISLASALEGAGSVAVEQLAREVCSYLGEESARESMQTTVPLHPGMEGWSVAEGQPLIFDLFADEELPITLTESCLMIPKKSLSFLTGAGKDVKDGVTVCEVCSLRDRCTSHKFYKETESTE